MSLLKALHDQCNIFTHYHAFFNVSMAESFCLFNISYPWYLEEY